MSSTTQRINGIDTLIRSSGRPGSEAVVFVHGFLGSSEDFSALLADVGELVYAVAPDMPNHGRSARPDAFPCTVQGYADHLAAVLAQLRIRRAHLVLHDFGGPWGLAWAARHPGAVASVSMFNFGIMPGFGWHSFARLWRIPILGELSMACMPRWLFRMLLRRRYARPLPDAVVDRMFDDLDWAVKRAGLALYRSIPRLGALTEQLGTQLASRRLPALVMWGDADPDLPARYASRQRAYFEVEGVHVLPGCGHWPFLDEPERCGALLRAFVRRQLQAPAPQPLA